MIILFWSAYVVFAIIYEVAQADDPAAEQISVYLGKGDTIACAFFFIDVIWRWLASPNKLTFWKWGWIDLLSSIPMFDVARWGRIFRALAIIRIIRAMRSAERVIAYFFSDSIKAASAFACVILFGGILMAGVLVLSTEHGAPNANIMDAGDALWWAVTTVTTVGYGDKYPVTADGRLVGAVLMFVGVSVFSMVSAILASSILRNVNFAGRKKSEGQIDEIYKVIAELREDIKTIKDKTNVEDRGDK